jgi:hypothetical protein
MSVRPLRESDLPAAAKICRIAFGTFTGAPEPETFWTDREYVRGRWGAAHTEAFAAEAAGQLVGSNFATNGAASVSSGRSRCAPTCGTAGPADGSSKP